MYNKEFPYLPYSFSTKFISTVPCCCDNGKNPVTGKNCHACGGKGRRVIKNTTPKIEEKETIAGMAEA